MVKNLRGLALLAVMATAGILGVAAPASADPTKGTIAGHFTDGGAPMPGVTVFVSKTDGMAFSYSITDSSGFYRTSELPPGDYKVEFDLRWGRQYAHQKLGWDEATIYAITAGAEIVVDDSLLPTGSMSGRFTAQDGSGIAGVNVSGNGIGSATTDAEGNWQIPRVFARTDYNIHFMHWERHISQYAYGKTDYNRADRIAVVAGANTVVNDTLLPTGSLRVTARDSVTGAPITNLFVNVATAAGSTETGELILADIPVGTHAVWAYAEGYLSAMFPPKTTIVAGQQSDIQVTLDPYATIEATVVDAATGEPLAGVCVGAVQGETAPTDGCWPVSDAEGKVSVSSLRGGRYHLIAFPSEAPGYGVQWVGANGGTGKQHLAAVVEVGVGQTATAPVIKMDRAGSIAGTVTLPSGAPAKNGWVGVYGIPIGSGAVPPFHGPLDEAGHYRLDNFGPYDWQLYSYILGEAPQYSGGVANRLLARVVPVTVGGTSTYDWRLRAGVAVTVNITGAEQFHPTVKFYNAVTGDLIANRQVYPEPFSVTLPVVGPQFVKIAVEDSSTRSWVGGTDQASATLFWIPGSGSKTIQINL